MIIDTLGKVAVVGSGIPRPYLVQGVVTYALPVEAFAIGIKMESRSQSRDQEEFRATSINQSTHFLRYYGGVATFCPLNSHKIQ